MSASDKKKLRKAEQAEKMTEKQLAEQKEAKKLKIYTSVFVIVLALMVVFAAVTATVNTIKGSGIREKNTVALTLNDQELNNAELNFYYIDGINKFFSDYGEYAYLFGIDTTVALNEQVYNEETGETWADYFLTTAVENAKSVYAMNLAAQEAGFTLSDEQEAEVNSAVSTVEMYAIMNYGYPTLEDYLKAMYGRGATEETYRTYYTMGYTADAFQTYYAGTLSYEDADLREAEAANYNAYSSYSYNYYYLNAQSLAEKDENGNSTDEQLAAAVELAKEYAQTLTQGVANVEALDAAVAALPINAEVENAASIASNDVLYGQINSVIADWVTASHRKAGDITYIPSKTTSIDENGNETNEVTGYYVVLFNGSTDNNTPMSNVRHILAAFEGGTLDEESKKIYSESEKNAAKLEAEKLLTTWKNGEATEDSFAALANENSADGDGTTGGLYEDINPSTNFVENFKNWALAAHEVGDTEIIETEYGYHVMYYCGASDLTYRDYMITNDLRTEEMNQWYTDLVAAMTATVQDTRFISKDLVMTQGQ